MNGVAFIFLFNILVISTASSSKIPSDIADDAEAALDNLRLAVITGLNQAAVSYAEFSKDIDAAALETKGSTLKVQEQHIEHIKSMDKSEGLDVEKCLGVLGKRYVSDVASCVDEKANSTIEYLSTWRINLIDSSLISVFDEERGIVLCGRTDDVCLNGVVKAINADIILVPESISKAVDTVEADIKQQIADILACKDQTMSKIVWESC